MAGIHCHGRGDGETGGVDKGHEGERLAGGSRHGARGGMCGDGPQGQSRFGAVAVIVFHAVAADAHVAVIVAGAVFKGPRIGDACGDLEGGSVGFRSSTVSDVIGACTR